MRGFPPETPVSQPSADHIEVPAVSSVYVGTQGRIGQFVDKLSDAAYGALLESPTDPLKIVQAARLGAASLNHRVGVAQDRANVLQDNNRPDLPGTGTSGVQ